MAMIHVNSGEMRFNSPSGWGVFTPQGKLDNHGVQKIDNHGVQNNPIAWSSKVTWSARLFVGFNVGKKPRWNMPDVVKIVKRVRQEQTEDPSSSFLAQKGIYKHKKSDDIVNERGAQVIIINTASGSGAKQTFIDQMVQLAETLAEKLRQEEVILEIQKNGVVQQVFGVTA